MGHNFSIVQKWFDERLFGNCATTIDSNNKYNTFIFLLDFTNKKLNVFVRMKSLKSTKKDYVPFSFLFIQLYQAI